ncbi:hypothetical protein [Thermococcus henrietii]|uniref:hypothetical protein n=1 Tax=Thermococcus henrietii TaxID=2016361 RepID=UPI000C06D918|nr:hypothetical protein [Thermococcus henrietii]
MIEYIIYTEFPGFVIVRRHKIKTKNYQPQWERSKKQFRAVDPLGKPLPRQAVHVKKFAPLWRTGYPFHKEG